MTSQRHRWRALILVTLLGVSAGCHRIVIDSGLEPTPQTYHEEWNLAFGMAIYPAQVDASSWCGGWFSRVETKQSFLNGVVNSITSSIISPMDVRVVCAAAGTDADAASTDATGAAAADPARDDGTEARAAAGTEDGEDATPVHQADPIQEGAR